MGKRTRGPAWSLLGVAAALLLGACDTWFGAEEVPLPGKRISVLLHDSELRPDPELAASKILLPPPSINHEWPQSGGYANHAMHHTQAADVPRRAWSTDIGTGASDTERLSGEPVVGEGKVFAIDAESTVSALDLKTGRILWDRDLTPDEEDDGHIPGGLAYYQGAVYATTGFAEVVAMDARTGKVKWRRNAGAPMRAAPAARHGRIFVITLENKLLALNAETGEVDWSYTGVAEEAGLLGSASPAVDAGIVVAPFTSGELVALRADNGRVLWTEALSTRRLSTGDRAILSHIRGNPVIDRGMVIAATQGGLIAAIDLNGGRRIWEQEVGGMEMPWVVGDYIYMVSSNAEVLCLSRQTGGIHWVSALPRWEDEEDRKDPIVWSGPLVVSDRVIVAGSNETAFALSPYSGKLLGKIELPDRITIPPVIAEGTILFLADNADLVAYR